MTDKTERPVAAARRPQTGDIAPRYTTAQLLGPAREAVIEHAGQEYRLRITAKEKLILTK